MPWLEIKHADSTVLSAALAAELSIALDEALGKGAVATLALAGGRTSPPIMQCLAAQPRDWHRVSLVPTDERWVEASHPDCNLRQLRSGFASHPEIRWIPLAPAVPTGNVDAAFANAGLAGIAETDFDAVLLGMGVDGHFASLFAGAPGLTAGLDPASTNAAVAIIPDPMPEAGPHPRISLTLARLMRSRRVMLAITGEEKRSVLERAMRENDPARLPVAALLHAPGSALQVHWSP